MAKKKAVAVKSAEPSVSKRLYNEGQLARTDRQSLDQSPYAVDDPQRVEWERGWLEQRQAECRAESLCYGLQEVGVTTALADLDQLDAPQAIALLDWIDYAPVDEHDGDATAAWLAALPVPLRLTGETVPADEERPECRVIEFTLPPLPPFETPTEVGSVADASGEETPTSAEHERACDTNPFSDLPQSEVQDADLMLAFDNLGVAIDETQWRRMEQIDRDTALRWLNGRRIGVLSPVPSSLMPYANAKLKGEYAIYWDAAVEERRCVLIPVKFGKPSVSKPDDGQTIKMTLAVPVDQLSPDSADALFRYKRCRIGFSRRATTEWDQPELPGVKSLNSIITTEADVSGYQVTRHDRKFAFLVEEALLSIPDAFDLWECRGSCRIEVLGEPISKKKNEDEARTPEPDQKAKAKQHEPARDAGDTADTLPFARPAGDEPLHPAMSAVVQALCDAGVLLPTESEIEAWTDEERDEVLDWCKAVLSGSMANSEHFGGSIAIPECLVTVTAVEQDNDPVAFLFENGPNKDAMVSTDCFCRECNRRMEIADELDFPVVCEQCNSDEDVERLGFYFEPLVNYDGDFIAGLSEYLVPINVDGFRVELIASQDNSNFWRVGHMVDLPGSEGECKLPNVKDPSHGSEQLAVEAVIGRMIDGWSKLTEVKGITKAVASLKQYLGQITSGKTPSELAPVEVVL